MKNRSSRHLAANKPVISSLALAILTTLIATGAQADTIGATTDISNRTASAQFVVAQSSLNFSSVSATVNDGVVSNTANGSGTVTNASISASDNTFAASAGANDLTNVAPLSGTPNGIGFGTATLGVAINSGAINSFVTNNTIGADQNLVSGAIAVSGNTISATTVVNKGLSTVLDVVPNDFQSAGVGASINSEAAVSRADIVVTSSQTSNVPSAATATDNKVSLIVSSVSATAAPAVDKNTITATFEANNALNKIDIQAGGAPSITASAAVTNVQLSQGQADASNTDSAISAASNGLAGALSLQGNAIASSATGNKAGNSIVLSDAISFAGNSVGPASASLSSVSGDLLISNKQQKNDNLSSTTDGGAIVARVAGLDGQITVTGNTITASGVGNALSSSIASGSGAASFAGTAALANEQSNNSRTNVSNLSGAIGVVAGTADASKISISNNTIGATVLGNQASQNLTLESTAFATGSNVALLASGVATADALVVSAQTNTGDTVALTALASIGAVSGFGSISGISVGTDVAIDLNRQSAVAIGNSAANALTLTGTALGNSAAVANTQNKYGNAVNATLSDATIYALQLGNVDAATLSVSKNTQQTVAVANTATNALNVNANTLNVASSIAPEIQTLNSAALVNANAALSNMQFSTVGVNATTTVTVVGGSPLDAGGVIGSAISGSAGNSNVKTDGNIVSATALGNEGINGISIDAGSIAASGIGYASVAGVVSNQRTVGPVSATAVTNGVGSTIGGDAFGSTVTASANTISARATGNAGNNTLDVSTGNVTVIGGATTAAQVSGGSTSGSANAAFALQNTQELHGDVTAKLSMIGAPSEVRINVGGDVANSTLTANDNIARATATGNSAANALKLSANLLSGGSALQSGQANTNAIRTNIGTPDVDGQAGVTLAVGGEAITGSTLSVNGNSISGSATGNSVSNSIAVSANAISNGVAPSIIPGATQGASSPSATADNVLSNGQTNVGAVASTVYGAFAIDAASAAVANATLTVSGNSQRAFAVANTALNALSASANALPATAALQSTQINQTAVSALSNLQLSAPASASASSVALSNNRNVALAVANDATNGLTVAGTNVGSNGSVSIGAAVVAEQALSNTQFAAGMLTATAATQLQNQDRVLTTAGIDNSTLAFSGNTTQAEASANRAINTATVTGAASQAAGVALNNSQFSYATVASNATVFASLLVNGGTSAALNNGSVAIDGNVTTALARGNAATNVLNSVAGSNYGIVSGIASVGTSGSPSIVNADAGISNSQSNSGTVTATSSNAINQVALNSGALLGTIGTVGVTGNTVTADAFGNSTTNRLTVSALNTGAPAAAIANTQSNSGAVAALVSGANFGINLTGTVGNSTLRANGNQVTATAVGNSAASTIIATR